MNRDMVHLSKVMSLLLRHKPETAHLSMDGEGWVGMEELLHNMNRFCGTNASLEDIQYVVAHNEKKRFMVSSNGKRIRACQGHSISVDLGLKPIQPPPRLYHGTAKQFVPSILQKGLLKMTRQYVHLSYSVATARSVGMRHGVPVVLEINAEQMARDGIVFYRSENGVWLTDSVSPCYISVLSLLCCYQSLHGERINTVPIDHFRPYCCCS